MRNDFTLLRATSSDLTAACQAIAELHLPTSSHRGTTLDCRTVLQFLQDPGRYLLLAVEGEKVVGSLYGYALEHPHRTEPQFFLYGIDVRPEYWNRGIGSALVERFIREANLAGAFEVWVLTNEANKAAMKMYAKCGLERDSSGDVLFVRALGPRVPCPQSD